MCQSPEAVERHEIDLIVMGCSGVGTFAKLVFGSVTTAVARDATIPVTLVN